MTTYLKIPACMNFSFDCSKDLRIVKNYCALFEILVDEKTN